MIRNEARVISAVTSIPLKFPELGTPTPVQYNRLGWDWIVPAFCAALLPRSSTKTLFVCSARTVGRRWVRAGPIVVRGNALTIV